MRNELNVAPPGLRTLPIFRISQLMKNAKTMPIALRIRKTMLRVLRMPWMLSRKPGDRAARIALEGRGVQELLDERREEGACHQEDDGEQQARPCDGEQEMPDNTRNDRGGTLSGSELGFRWIGHGTH